MCALRPCELAADNGLDPEAPIARFRRLQTADAAIEEIAHSAIGIMVQGTFPDAAILLY